MLIAIALTVLVTALMAGLMIWAGPVDTPRARGSHQGLVPTAGGLATLTGLACGVLALVWLGPAEALGQPIALLLAATAAMALIGAWDDVFDIGALPKLVLQVAVALAFAIGVGGVGALPLAPGMVWVLPAWLGVAGATLWIVTVTNAYNFMDGVDGLAIGAQALALFSLSLIADAGAGLAFALLAAAVANLALLPFNHPARRLFQGDAGALGMGFLIGGAALLMPRATSSDGLYMAAFAAAPLLVDVLLTLLGRARARDKLFQAHRQHLYQRWQAAAGRSHGAVARRVWILCALSAAVGLAVHALAPEAMLMALIGVFAALAMLWTWAGRRLQAA